MIKVLIIEDEVAASKRLQKLLAELMPDAAITDIIVSINAAVNWFKNNQHPDLVFADIHLADGSSFEIFKQVKLDCPVIFITAYDQYALEAFKHNSIHYLLKPVKKEDLTEAIAKFRKMHASKANNNIDIEKMLMSFRQPAANYKERFIIRFGEHIKTIETQDIAYFYTENKANYAVMKDGKRYPVDHNLDELETLINPKSFFRINRQFIIGYNSITEMVSYSKSRVLIKLNPPSKFETIVSTERSAAFKSWLAGE
ncbi:response regulator transcription factor [Panacibacter ginsenosidivorans]|uniref:Response regulator transcription factor n=1 Tax=Panacibacter ginsenosidivorans TaxID=1813871 RepID=A0A5B8VC21_9BACT|nr:LytTR family DNA-binding domain-containing protein [Panacibacter ginsenosidivorans]QEC68553.1 response regulator transcription factor [Panacibacter ginsenosidivorans]